MVLTLLSLRRFLIFCKKREAFPKSTFPKRDTNLSPVTPCHFPVTSLSDSWNSKPQRHPVHLDLRILLLSLTQRKKQRNIRPSKASPQGRMQTNNRSTPSIISMFWYRGTTRYFFIGWRVESTLRGRFRVKKNSEMLAKFKIIT